MNFKKFISGVSALTIAASAFAGMAVTANAATASVSSWVCTDGTYGYAEEITDTADYLNSALGTASVTGAYVNQNRGSGTYTVLSDALEADPNGNLTIEFGLDIVGGSASGTAGDTTQTICFMGSEYTPSGRTLQNVPSNDVLFKLSKTSAGDVYLNGDTALSITNNFSDYQNLGSKTARNATGLVKYKVVLDFTNDSLTLYADKGTGYPSTGISGSILDADATGLYGIFVNSSNKRSYSGFVMTDISYEEYVPSAATGIRVDYTSGGSTVASKTIDISAAEKMSGDTSDTFYLPAYITDASGNVYSTNLSSYAKTVTLAEGITPVDVPVTALANSQYVEYDGEGTVAGRDSYASNGSIKTIGATHTTVITASEDGVYTLVVATAPNTKTSGDRAYYVSVNDGETAIESAGKVGYFTGAHTYTNIALKTGDNITYYGGAGTVGIDYVLLTKTAEYPYAITKAATEKGSFDVSAETATAGTNVTITPSAAEGYEVDTVSVATADVTDNGNGTYSFTMPASDVTVSVTFKAIPVAGPTAEVTGISYKQFEKASDSDKDITAAKVYVETTGTVKKLGLKYNDSEPIYAKGDLTMTDATIVLGAIVPDIVNLEYTMFTAVAE